MPTRTRKTTKVPLNAVTLREIEEVTPCNEGYYPFLKDVGGEPINTERYTGFKRPKRIKVGPDDPISLEYILDLKSSGDQDGAERVSWLFNHLIKYQDDKLRQSVDEEHSRVYALALINTLSKWKGSKK